MPSMDRLQSHWNAVRQGPKSRGFWEC
jgi:hypothetical protein